MLVIRLFRVGKKNQPFFKVVVTDKKRPPRAGRFVEEVGNYNPLTKEENLKVDRIKYWLTKGAKPSNTIHNLLVSEKIIDAKKIPVHKKAESKAVVPAPGETATKDEQKPVPEKPIEPEPAEEKPTPRA